MSHRETDPQASSKPLPPAAHRPPHRTRWLLASLVLAAVLPAVASAEIWTDATEAFKIEADFLALRGQTVYLKKTNGVTIAVPLSRLNAQSQQLARQLAGPTDTPDAAMRALAANAQAGEFGALWAALPASYQQDVQDVIHAFGENMDPDIWNAGVRIVKKAVAVLRDKKALILAHPGLQRPEMDLTALADNWDSAVALLQTIADSELSDLSKLRVLDMEAFLQGTGKQLGTQIASLSKAMEQNVDAASLPVPLDFPGAEAAQFDLENVKITLLAQEGDTATVRFESGDETTDEPMVRVQGKWLPKKMVDGWEENIAQAKQFLATEMPQTLAASKQQLLSPLSPLKMVEGVLDQLAAAQDQQQFNQVVNGVLQMVGGLMGPGAPGAPETAPGAASPFGAPPAADDPFGAPPAPAPAADAPAGAPPAADPATGGAPADMDDLFGPPAAAGSTSSGG